MMGIVQRQAAREKDAKGLPVTARLRNPQRPPPADTTLALREAPRADPHRDDRLRAADAQEADHAN